MKKILSIFALLMTIVIGAKADDVYKLQLNGADAEYINGTKSASLTYFSKSGKHNFNSKFNGCTYDGVSYTNGLKMEGDTNLSWTSTAVSTVVIVQSTWSDKTINFDGTALAVADAASITGGRVYTISNVAAGSHSVTRGSGESGVFAIYVTEASSKTITNITLDGVKIDGSTAAETTDYTISGTTITLTGSYSIAPEVSLIEKTTYDEGDPTTKDIAVTLTKGEAYFTGTATIGAGTDYETEYTVQVPVSTDATLEADVTALSVSSLKVATGTAKFNVVGANLTGESVSLAFDSAVNGLTVSPASIEVTDGEVNQEVTISYYSTEDVAATNVNLTITSAGVDAITIPVTYSSTAGIEDVTPVSETTTWDWSTAASATIASPDANNVVVLANSDGWASTFNAEAIAAKASNFWSSKSAYKYCQASILKFNAAVDGKVSVYFSNTGSKSEYRWLAVNNVVTEYKSKTEDEVSALDIPVTANQDVVIEAIMGTSAETAPEYTAANTMLNFRKVVFTVSSGKEACDLAVSASATVETNATTNVSYTTSSTGAVTVESSDETVATATVDQVNKIITIAGHKVGSATITVSQAEDDDYDAGSKAITVTVSMPSPVAKALPYTEDFTTWAGTTFSSGASDNIDVINGIYFRSKSSSKQFSASANGVTFPNNNYSSSYFMGILLSGIEGKIKVTAVADMGETTDSKPSITYAFTAGATEIGSAPSGTKVTAADNAGAIEFIIDCDEENAVLYLGRGSSNAYDQTIKSITIENVADEVVTVGQTGFATIGLPFATTLPEGVTGYKATAAEGSTVTLAEVASGTEIASNTGLIIVATPGNYTFAPIAGVKAMTNNLLKATGSSSISATAEGDFYYFAIIDSTNKKVGFKKCSATATLAANKAYLPGTGLSANSLTLKFADDATAINGINANDNANSAAPLKVIKNGQLFIGNYNVAGARVK